MIEVPAPVAWKAISGRHRLSHVVIESTAVDLQSPRHVIGCREERGQFGENIEVVWRSFQESPEVLDGLLDGSRVSALSRRGG